jgi:hypothetical protein
MFLIGRGMAQVCRSSSLCSFHYVNIMSNLLVKTVIIHLKMEV